MQSISQDELRRRLLECGGVSVDDAENRAVRELFEKVEALQVDRDAWRNNHDKLCMVMQRLYPIVALVRKFCAIRSDVDAVRQEKKHVHNVEGYMEACAYELGVVEQRLNAALLKLDGKQEV
jgi:hypothetical protein